MNTHASSSIKRLFWSGGEDVSLARMLAAGAFVVVIYCALQLAVNGIFLDEVIEPAQIIAGAVHYPTGHPHQLYYNQVFSLPNYLAAALWRIVPEPLVVSAIRNFFFLFVSVFTPFAATVLLTRKPLWGHFAAALTLTETGLRFSGTYPMWVFPGFNSHGHLGLYIALLAAVLLLARCWRVAGLLIGLLPALHGAMILVVWPWAFAYLVFSKERPRGRDRFQFFAAAVIGLAICAVLAGVIYLQNTHAAVAPPYDVQANADILYRNFTDFADFHRNLQAFQLLSFGYLANLVAFAALGAWLWWNSKQRSGTNAGLYSRTALFWILCFGGIVWACVFGAQWAKILTGAMPGPLEMLMPLRFSNFSALLLIPVTVAIAAAIQEDIRDNLQEFAWLVWSTLLGAAGMLLLLEGSVFGWLYRGRVTSQLIFAVWGILFALGLFTGWPGRASRLVVWAAFLSIFGSLLLIPKHTSVVIALVACFVIAAVLGLAARRYLFPVLGESPHRIRALQVALLLAIVFTSAAALKKTDSRGTRRTDTFSQDDRALAVWLQTNAHADELILPAIYLRSALQVKTGHPVLMESQTYYIISYAPHLSPVIARMSQELYGINLEDREDLKRLNQIFDYGWVQLPWQDPWKLRLRAEWQLLGRKYGFRLVLSPVDVPLDLPVAFAGRIWTLYTIPDVAAAEIKVAGNAISPKQ